MIWKEITLLIELIIDLALLEPLPNELAKANVLPALLVDILTLLALPSVYPFYYCY